MLEELNARERARGRERLVVRSPERSFFLRTETIDYIEAAGKFVHLHVGRTVHALRESMAELEQELDPARFLRVHRSHAVNIETVKELRPQLHGEYSIVLSDGTEINSGRSYKSQIQAAFGLL